MFRQGTELVKLKSLRLREIKNEILSAINPPATVPAWHSPGKARGAQRVDYDEWDTARRNVSRSALAAGGGGSQGKM